jgi:hypothetical protein
MAQGEKLSKRSYLYNNQTGETHLTWYKTDLKAQAIQSLSDALESFTPKPLPKTPTPKGKKDSDLLTLYTLTDFHLGMYSWAEESGEDWDTEIASRVMLSAVKEMAEKSCKAESCILNIQGDFLHWDGLDAVTPANKHILDADTRFGRLIELSLDLITWSIEILLAHHKKVHVIICEGNHDPASAKWLPKSLSRIFRSNPRVEFDNSEFPYYAYLHGQTMLGFHHGHKKKNKDLPALFSSEPRFRSMWGEATYTYIHSGHYHFTEQDMAEAGGAIVERHPTLASRDAYAARGGWVSRRAARAITYHKTDGEVERVTVVPR